MGRLTHKEHGLDEETIRHLYLELFLSDSEIGKRFGLTGEGVAYFRKKYGIQTMKSVDRVAGRAKLKGLRDIREVSAEEFGELYRKDGERKLAKLFGCSKILIRRMRQDFGIAPISKASRQRSSLPSELTQAQKEVLMGSLLGDGCISLNKAGDSARYSESHSTEQREYLCWKQSVLHPFSRKIGREGKILKDGRVAKGVSLRCHFHPVFVALYHSFYSDGKKKLPEGLIETLTPLSLAVWYMDDGHLADATLDGVFTLATCFTDYEAIADVLNERFSLDIECRPRPEDNITILWIHNKDRFFSVIGKHVHPSMSYKIPLSLRFGLPHFSRPALATVLKDFSVSRHVLLSEEEKEKQIDDLVDYWQIAGFPYPVYKKKKRLKEIGALKSSVLKLEDEVPVGHTQGSSYCVSNFSEFWKARRKGGQSPYQVFRNRNRLKHIIKDCIKYRQSVSDAALRAELQICGGVHTFRPAIAKAVYDTYCTDGGSVLDPCSGYGGRLLGFFVSEKAKSYVGIDANADTVAGLKHMRNILSRDIEGKDAKIVYASFEDWKKEQEFDLVFTSPPYFCKEIYGTDEKLSDVRYETYEEWLEKFFFVLVRKSFDLLRKGAYLVLNVANIRIDKKHYPISDDLLKYIKGIGLQLFCTHLMKLSSPYSKSFKHEPIHVFRK